MQEIYIKQLQLQDAEDLLRLLIDNRQFFKEYTPLKDEAFYTLEGQIERIEKRRQNAEEGVGHAFGVFISQKDLLVGVVSLSEIARGDYQSCWIGYYLDEKHNGRGFMTEAVKMAVDFGFTELGLHRIEAGVMPRNTGSMRVLEKAGFHREGIAKENVRINGKWEDHQILAIINEKG